MAFKRVIIRRVGPLSWLLGTVKKIFLAALILASNQAYACSLVPDEILDSLKKENPKEVVSRLWDRKECEAALFTGLGSGKAEWIKVAVALRPHTDAWSGESLILSLGEAMQRAPSRVLPLVDTPGFGKQICLPDNFDDSKEAEKRFRIAVLKSRIMFKSFIGSKLESKARVCLAEADSYLRRK